MDSDLGSERIFYNFRFLFANKIGLLILSRSLIKGNLTSGEFLLGRGTFIFVMNLIIVNLIVILKVI